MPLKMMFEWMAYDQIDPIGRWRNDLNAAVIVTSLANLFGRNKNQRPYKPSEFMPRYQTATSKKQKTPGEIFRIFKAFITRSVAPILEIKKDDG